jgi:hypothetical protein
LGNPKHGQGKKHKPDATWESKGSGAALEEMYKKGHFNLTNSRNIGIGSASDFKRVNTYNRNIKKTEGQHTNFPDHDQRDTLSFLQIFFNSCHFTQSI